MAAVPASAQAAPTGLQRSFAFALMAVAGWCDAAGFMMFAQLYVSFMSGDATQLGVTLGRADWSAAARFFAAQALFVAGAALGRLLRVGAPRSGRRVVLGANVVLLGAVAALGQLRHGDAAFVLAVIAMGMQNAVLTHEAGVPVGTMITGALARLGLDIADLLRGRPAPAGDNLAQWAFFVLGAVGGAVTFDAAGAGAFWAPSLASAALIPLAMRLPERSAEQPRT